MFQATGVEPGFQRPAIMHAYGGAKTGMAGALATIAPEGWLPLAAAMLGTVGKPPMWASVGLRPVVVPGHHHRSESTTSSPFGKRKAALTFLLAAVGSSWSTRLRPISMVGGCRSGARA